MVDAVDAIEHSIATASIGIASGCAQRIDEVVIEADRAMYAGQAGRRQPAQPGDLMDDVNALAARMLERGQSGEAATIIVESERVLRERTGDLLDGPAADPLRPSGRLSTASGDSRAALAAGELMLIAAEREGDHGWVSCAYSLNAHVRLSLGESDVAEHDLGTVLRELVHAENAAQARASMPGWPATRHTARPPSPAAA